MTNAPLMSLNTMTVRDQWNLREAIEGCARHGVPAIAPWRDKLEECGVAEAATMIADHGLAVSSLCRGGMFTAADAGSRQDALDDNRRAVDDAVAIGARCLVLVVGGLPQGSRDLSDARGQVRDGIGALLEHSRSAGLPLALEPLHPMYAA
ncbi:MAG: sugar phosphate isomerase/epimerase family protein, partial [Gammaproteobacteria bacterium]